MLLATNWWFVNVTPHLGATSHNDIWWGVVHGLFVVPNFVYSLFDGRATIYQRANTGVGYNFGYLGGLVVFFGPVLQLIRRR